MKFLLLPVAILYERVVGLRNWLYAARLLKVHRLQKPVVSVGNLTMGGTGKTPTVIALGQWIQRSGYRVAVLMRGYRGRNSGDPLLVSDGNSLLADSRLAGDEAVMIARNLPGAVVAVAKNRAEAGRWLESRFSIDLHLLDDGFQHLKLHRDMNLLLVDVTNPFGGGQLPPLGRLRENPSGMARADAVIFTRTQGGRDYSELTAEVRRFNGSVPCFRARQLFVTATENQGNAITAGNLRGKSVLAFAGIANPNQFFDFLVDLGVNLRETMRFPDHHRYRDKDLARIRQKSLKLGVETIVTTEKDKENCAVEKLTPLEVVVIKIAFEFENQGGIRALFLEKAHIELAENESP